jgi:hypothetical protein
MVAGCLFVIAAGCTASDRTVPQGFVEGHLHIYSGKPVELADENLPPVTTETYAEYPLVILTRDKKKEIAQVTAGGDGHYRVGLPPGAYVLDVQNRVRKHVRAIPQMFTVVANQTVWVDMDMDTGIR